MKNAKDSSSSSATRKRTGHTRGGSAPSETGASMETVTRKTDRLIGSLIDNKYKILEKIGGGAMGSVYKAEHTMMERIVAIKILHRHLAVDVEDDEFIKRFQREARTASKIEHPNAVTIYDFGSHNDQAYLVMQFNPGKSLKQVLAEDGAIPPRRTLKIMSQVCKALSTAHKLNIVHRDLKPDNIMCFQDDDGSERVQVLDFGIAKVVDDPDGQLSTMTKTGIVMGTPQYMAPEQAIGQELDARSDVYSLGIILYEMLTGQLPFTADTAMQIMLKHINERPVPLSETSDNNHIPPDLEAVVSKALKKEPRNRHQSVRELVEDLRAAVLDPKGKNGKTRSSKGTKRVKPVVVTDIADPDDETAATPAVRRRRKPWTIGSLCTAIILGVSAGFLINPAITYFSPEEIAKRAAAREQEEQVQKHIKLARDYVEHKNLSAAVHELIKASDIAPEDARIYYELGATYAKQAKWDQAIVVLENAVQLDPKFAKAHFSLGNMLYKRGRFSEAVSAYERTLELDPKNKRARQLLKRTRHRLGTY